MKKWTFRADGAGDSIGGSSYIHNGLICIDHGAIQDNKKVSYPPMAREELPIFILSHDHLDHCGGVPIFALEHPESKLIMTKTAFEGMLLQLKDSLKITSFQAKSRALRGLSPEPMAFDYLDVENLMDSAGFFVKNTGWFEPLAGYKMSFRSAGHKPGAAMFLIVFPDGTRVLHACDISLDEQALIKGAGVPKDFLDPDVLVVECTYGNREIPERVQEEQRLVDTVKNVFARGGKVIIPHFASTLGNVAIPLAKAGIPTNIDGMGRAFMDLYQRSDVWCEEDKPFSMKDFGCLYFVDGGSPREDHFYREELVQQAAPVAIISSSGMLEAGPSVFYVTELIEDPRNAVIIPGYQAKETQGRKLLQLQRSDNITFSQQKISRDGFEERSETRQILADIFPFKLSGHSGGNKMAEWICQINPKKVVTVHGEPESHEGLKDRVQRLNKKIEIVSAKNGETLEFSFRN